MHKIFSICHFKRDIFPVEIEIDTTRGIFRFDIIGLGDKAVEESKSRILSAIKNSGYRTNRSTERITVLLSPASKKKEGSHFDLPIALAYLQKTGAIEARADFLILGELSLYGEVKPVQRICEYIFNARKFGCRKCIVPADNKGELMAFPEATAGVDLRFASSLKEAAELMQRPESKAEMGLEGHADSQGSETLTGETAQDPENEILSIDLVKGQEHVKRALEISLAGNHHLMICGIPGTGKTMLAKSAAGLISRSGCRMKDESILESGSFEEAQGRMKGGTLVEPHHTQSYADLIGSKSSPGMLRSADNGILLMDEWTEFDRRALESLREPLEEGTLFGYHCRFTCIATANPCPCGYMGSKNIKCSCKADRVAKYRSKLSGPILQRFDLFAHTNEGLQSGYAGHVAAPESSKFAGADMRKRISKVRSIQRKRMIEIMKNESVSRKAARLHASAAIQGSLDAHAALKLLEISRAYKLNQRLADSLLLVARTAADLDESENVTEGHILEAASYIPRQF